MRVVLLNPPSEKGYIRSGRWTRKSRGNQSWYPVWLAYATALLEREGHECYLLDFCGIDITYSAVYHLIKKSYQPQLIVYYFGYDTWQKDLEFADILAEGMCKVVLVGPWSYCLPDALKYTPHIQLMTYGEFEHTLLEIVQNPNTYSTFKGTYYKNHLTGEIVKNEPRPLCSSEELDKIPFVTKIYKKHLDISRYRQTSFRHPFVDLLTARSCPHHCTYCVWIRAFQYEAQHEAFGRYRTRSIEDVVEELWWIKENLPQVKQIFFQDDTLPQKRAVELSQAILDEGLKICWGGYSRAELSYETLKLMKESGCRTLHVGYETPIQRYLDLIQKDITISQMKEFADNVRKLGLWTSATFMIFPWETEEEIKVTVEWCKRIKPKRMNLIQAQAYPNTPYEKTVQEFGERYKLMSFEEMKQWEKYGFKEFYLSKEFLWDCLKSPLEWGNIYQDAKGLLSFLWSK